MSLFRGALACALAGACLSSPAFAATPSEIVVNGRVLEAPAVPIASVSLVDADTLVRTTSVIETQDLLRYLPSLFVRRRHIGDTQATLATRTGGVGSSARSLVYADGVLLSALIGNNNSNAAPRWGMVSPEEVAGVEVLYGPYSAAYPGNAIGAVVNLKLRLPETLEATGTVQGQVQHLGQYGTSRDYPAGEVAATIGDRSGRLAWFLSADHLRAEGQPLAYATVARPAATSGAGMPVNGGFDDVNRTGAPILVAGASGLEQTRQTRLKARAALDLGKVTLGASAALFLNDADADAESYLQDGAGRPVFAGTVNRGGYAYTLPASLFSNNAYRLDERHTLIAATADGDFGVGGWRVVASRYHYDRDTQRLPTTALPAARDGGAGAIVRLAGTGWETLDGSVNREVGAHRLTAGAHYDRFTLASDRFVTADWRHGPAGALTQAARGHTATAALWLEDGWTLAPALTLTLGARQEWWRAYGGRNFAASPALDVRQPGRSAARLSPKASLGWSFGEGWTARLSAARAWRFPTVSELYQVVTTGPTLSVPDPTLRPERATSAELAVEHRDARGSARAALFAERVDDALISQTAPLVPGSASLFSFVQNIGRTRARGVELAVDRRDFPLRRLDLRASVTGVDAETVRDPDFPAAEGKRLPQVPRFRTTIALTWRPDDTLSLTGAVRHASRSFGTIDNSDTVGHKYQGFEGYTVIDLHAERRLGRRWSVAVGADNMTDRHYYIFHPFPGRSFTAELRYRL